MTALATILASTRPADGGFRVDIPEGWMQGRTTYGGLSSALALHAAKAIEADLPPLRSALIAFIGPLAGTVTIVPTCQRRGRHATFIDVRIHSDAGLGYRATFLFMAGMTSSIDYDALVTSPHRPPPPSATLYRGPQTLFTGNFELFDLKQHAGPAEWLRWARLYERDAVDDEAALIAVADALPPAAYRLHGGQGAISSLTWIINLLAPRPTTDDGWWLLSSRTERAAGGYSSQQMTVWDAHGRPVIDAMQGVAVFA